MRGYPPAVLFAVGLLFVILVLLHYSTVISRLADQNIVLAQRLALLEAKLRDDLACRVRRAEQHQVEPPFSRCDIGPRGDR